MTIWEKARQLTESGTSFVVITLTAVKGSAPQDPGAKAIVVEQGLEAGTVGGGRVEASAIKRAQEILSAGKQQIPESVSWNLQKDIGMTCGGVVDLVFEHFHINAWPIVVFGAGHVAQALTKLLSNMDCRVTCIDQRKDWLEKIEGVKTIHHPEPAELVPTLDPESFFISITMGHATDVPVLRAIAEHAPDCPYVGVIGSDIKGKRIKKELREAGVNEDFLNKLRVPIGLPLGKNHPWEIAVSITAELLQVRDR